MSAALKALLLLSCTFLGLICGTLYLYSSYSPQLAARLNYTATDSSQIALLGTIGIAVSGPVAGRLVDLHGYTMSLFLGGLCTVLGYYGLKIQYDHQYSSVTSLASLIFMIGCGLTLMNSACFKCCAISFPSIRGVATSLPLALYGLSALFYSVIGSVFYPGDTSSFLGFLAFSAAIIFIICTPRIIMADREHRVRRNRVAAAAATANSEFELTAIPNIEQRSSTDQHFKHSQQKQIGGVDLLKSREFWLIFIVTGALASMGQMYIYSVGYMVKALALHNHNLVAEIPAHLDVDSHSSLESLVQQRQLLQVGLLSIANCVGRIASGILGDVFSQTFHKPRSMLLFLPALGLTLAQTMGLRFEEYSDLSLLSLLVGFFYGFTFCIMPIIVGDAFGMDNFSLNWGFVGLAPILPSFYFTKLFGKTYDSNSSISEVTGTSVCVLGKKCYSSVFHITIWVTAFSVVVVTLINVRKRRRDKAIDRI